MSSPLAAEHARIDAAEAKLWADYATWMRGPFRDRIADTMALTALSELPPEYLGSVVSSPSNGGA